MSTELLTTGLTALAGAALGFLLSWWLEERKQQHELRRSVASVRVKAYRALWPLCAPMASQEQPVERADALLVWYEKGGGLFLSLAATERLLNAMYLLRAGAVSADERAKLEHHLSWLRTEMKLHIGSYTRREAKTKIKPVRARGMQGSLAEVLQRGTAPHQLHD